MALLLISVAAGKNDFLEKPPTDAIGDVNFYKTNEQELAGTSLLYSKVWFDYNTGPSYAIGDFRGGSAYSVYNNQDNVRFNTTGITNENGASWRSFFIVVGQSNLAMHNIETVSYTHLDVYKRQAYHRIAGGATPIEFLDSCLLYTSRCV